MNFEHLLGKYFENGFYESVIHMFFSIVICYVLYKLVKRIIKKNNPDNCRAILNCWKAFIVAIILYSCFSQFKPIQTLSKTLIASGGIIAIVASIAAQDTISNIVSGIMILFCKPYCIHDWIKINNNEYVGYVETITLRHTVIKTYEHNRVIIPNSVMNKASIENANYSDTKKANFLEVEISYETDIYQAINILQTISQSHPSCIDIRTPEQIKKKTPKVEVKVISFNENGILLRAIVFSETSIEGFNMLSDLRIQILEKFKEKGIEIPYPHRTILTKWQ